VIEKSFWKGSTVKHNGVPLGIAALIAQTAAFYLFIKGHSSFQDDSSPISIQMPFLLAAAMPVTHALLCLARSLTSKERSAGSALRPHSNSVTSIVGGVVALVVVAAGVAFVVSHAGDHAKRLHRAATASQPVTSASPSQPTPPTSAFIVFTKTPETVPARPELRIGDSGDLVTLLQTVLRDKVGQSGVTVDGDFGPATEAAVTAKQTFSGITPADGVVRATTWAVIDSLNGK
jgi:Putative peptidoglycan binding domain